MVAHILHPGKVVYKTSTPISPLISENFFYLMYEEFAKDLTKQCLEFINPKNLFQHRCWGLKCSVG